MCRKAIGCWTYTNRKHRNQRRRGIISALRGQRSDCPRRSLCRTHEPLAVCTNRGFCSFNKEKWLPLQTKDAATDLQKSERNAGKMRGPSRRFEGNQAISITDDVRPSGQQRHSSPLLGTHQRPNAQSLPPLVDVQRLAEEEDGRGVSCLMEDVEVSKDSRIRRLHAWNGVRIQTCRSENVAQRGPVPKIDDIGWPIHAKPVLPVNRNGDAI